MVLALSLQPTLRLSFAEKRCQKRAQELSGDGNDCLIGKGLDCGVEVMMRPRLNVGLIFGSTSGVERKGEEVVMVSKEMVAVTYAWVVAVGRFSGVRFMPRGPTEPVQHQCGVLSPNGCNSAVITLMQ